MPLADSAAADDPLQAFECRASTLDELLSDRFRALPGSKGTAARAAERLSAWCIASTGGDWSLFARRLARDGLTFEGVLSRLAGAAPDPAVPAPQWVADAAWVLAAMKSATAEPSRSIEPGTEPVAFEPLLSGLVGAALERVRAEADLPDTALPCEPALAPMSRALLVRLSELCSPCLHAALRSWPADRPAGSTPSAAAQAGPVGETAVAASFEPFADSMRESGLDRLFFAKPVLLRLIASVARQWIDSTLEFMRRLAADAPAIRATLLRQGSQGRVAAVEGGLADLHNGGRSVLLVTFDDGQRVLYKPKDLRPDAFWHRLVAGLNGHGAPIDLRAARVLVREGYGWAEFIEPSDCPDRDAVEGFYRRAGAWLALFHLFAAADMHYENLIAAGEQPVPIDLEMLLQMGKLDGERGPAERAALERARRRVDESIVATGFLPAYGRTPENAVIGLGGLNESPTDVMETFWHDVNTLRMRPARRRRTASGHANLPTQNGIPAPLSRFGPALVDGFEQYGRHLVQRGRDLVEAGWLEGMRGIPVRRLLRPTRFYVFLMERLRDPRHLGDGALWSAHLDFVARLSDWDEADPAWPLLRAERAALATLNVPFFLAMSDGTAVFDRLGHTAQGQGSAGLTRARERLLGWDDAELEWQRRIVSTSVSNLPGAPAPMQPRRADRDRRVPATRAERHARFRDAAREAAARIAGLAVRQGSSAAWIGLDWLGDSEVSQLLPLGFDLYNGAPGIALSLAAFGHVTGDDRSATLAIEALAPLRSHLHGANAGRLARGMGIGAATGLGSVVYSLSTIGSLLGREDVVADAVRAAHLCTDELIDADRVYDVIGGSAGGILGLLKLHRLTGDADVLERAERCGRHLLRHVHPAPAPGSAASTPGTGWRPLTGISHGAAGVGYAFAALHRATRATAFAVAARDCIAFENRTFSAAHQNWPDLRQQPAEQSWPCQWCYGAAGIGLARLATARCGYDDTSTVETDVRHAVACTLAMPASSVDHLCCGNLGAVEFLAEAAAFMPDARLAEEAERRLLDIVADAVASGDYRWSHGDDAFNPGFFRGLAGVGYTMLRRVAPDLPNVLVWA